MSKDQIRKSILARRILLASSEVAKKSSTVCRKFLDLEEIETAKILSIYLPINNEVDTKLIIDNLLKRQPSVYAPYYSKKIDGYFLAKLASWNDLEKGPYGIWQPRRRVLADPNSIDVAIIPGIAFSKKGIRLGYGKGVFDKLFSGSNALRVGLAYEFQIVGDLFKEEHDLIMNIVVTEKAVYRQTT